uniref:Uncharacterized protein n=1 Tax=Tetradesmus obliquus TaxID=3088 RepID=A0A383W486_TETOB|eukprot:jgi/Sobl393_1/3352/SZX72468.1
MADDVEEVPDQICLAAMLDVPTLLAVLGPQGLVCLAASSKSMQQRVEASVACSGSLVLLESAVATARNSSRVGKDTWEAGLLLAMLLHRAPVNSLPLTPYQIRATEMRNSSRAGRDMQAVGCLGSLLLCKAPAIVEDVASLVLNLPAVPHAVAEQLVAAGVRISYAQLLAAADSMVAGVEVWVQAQQQLGVESDIPAAAVAACCGDNKNCHFKLAFRSGVGAEILQLVPKSHL